MSEESPSPIKRLPLRDQCGVFKDIPISKDQLAKMQRPVDKSDGLRESIIRDLQLVNAELDADRISARKQITFLQSPIKPGCENSSDANWTVANLTGESVTALLQHNHEPTPTKRHCHAQS